MLLLLKIFQQFVFYGGVSLVLVTLSLLLFSLCVLSDSWELTRVRKEVLPLNTTTGWSLLEVVTDRMFIVEGDSVSLSQPWHQNSLLLAATHSGLWRTCLDVSLEEYRDLLTSFPWLGDRCVPLSRSVRQETGRGLLPPWLRVMNISISCCLTSLIIVTAAAVLSLVGMFYKQATCLLVDCVLMLISVFFFLLSLSLHWAHRHQRMASLSGSSQALLTSQPAWSQYLGQFSKGSLTR